MAERYCMHNQSMNDFIDENFEDIRAPFTAGFELTAKCNLNCVHCYAKPDRNHQDFTLDEFKSIFDTLVERGFWIVILQAVRFLPGLILKRCMYMQRKKES